MWKCVGLAALVVLVASESFAFFGAVFWALTEFFHLGKIAENGALALAVVLALAAGYWIYHSATNVNTAE
jgi:hypothetical protein